MAASRMPTSKASKASKALVKRTAKWTQVELAQRLALGGQTDQELLRKYTQVAEKKHFKADYPLFYWLIMG